MSHSWNRYLTLTLFCKCQLRCIDESKFYLLMKPSSWALLTSSAGATPLFRQALTLRVSPQYRASFCRYSSSSGFNFAALICSLRTSIGSKSQSKIFPSGLLTYVSSRVSPANSQKGNIWRGKKFKQIVERDTGRPHTHDEANRTALYGTNATLQNYAGR